MSLIHHADQNVKRSNWYIDLNDLEMWDTYQGFPGSKPKNIYIVWNSSKRYTYNESYETKNYNNTVGRISIYSTCIPKRDIHVKAPNT